VDPLLLILLLLLLLVGGGERGGGGGGRRQRPKPEKKKLIADPDLASDEIFANTICFAFYTRQYRGKSVLRKNMLKTKRKRGKQAF
jgi:hypothetical protein